MQKSHIILIVMQQEHFASHQKSLNMDILSYDIGIEYSPGLKFGCMVWNIPNNPPKFLSKYQIKGAAA